MKSKSSVLEHMAPPHWVVGTVKNRLNAMIIVGTMGAGKTTWVLNKIGQAQQTLLAQGVDDDDILTAHAQRTKVSRIVRSLEKQVDLPKVRYLYLFNDDALAGEGQHGRMFMSHMNIAESQFYTMLRHELEKRGFRGFIFAVHATQVYHLLDKTFRTTAKIHAFKDLPMDARDRREIGLMLGKAYYRALREISRKIWAPRSREELVEGLESCVVNFLGKRKVVKARPHRVINYLRIVEERKKEEKDIDQIALENKLLKEALRRILGLPGVEFKIDKKKYINVRINGQGRWRGLGPIAGLVFEAEAEG